MRQEWVCCSKSKVGLFWRRLADFLFLFVHYFLDLIVDSLSVLLAIVRGCVIDAFFVGGVYEFKT
jgi:hypothetical protein